MHRSLKYRIPAAVGALLMLGVMVGTPLASAAGSPALKVSPKSKLVNGSTVQVSGKHFAPGDSVFVLQCVTADQSLSGSGCNIANVVAVTISSKGTFGPVALKLKTGQIGSDTGTCGTSKTDAKACSVSAGNMSGGDKKQLTIAFTVPKA